MQRGRKRAILTILTVLLFLPVVSAQSITFNAFETIPITNCANVTYGFNIINNDVVDLPVHLVARGAGAQFVDLTFTDFVVPVGLSVLAQEELTIFCNAPEGIYPLTIEAQTARGFFSLEQFINVTRFPVASFSVPERVEGRTCEGLSIDGVLTNVGQEEARFELNISSDPALDVEVSPGEIRLDSGRSRDFLIEVDQLNCSRAEDFTLELEASVDIDVSTEVIDVIVTPSSIPVLVAPDMVYPVEGNGSIFIRLMNLGDLDADFTLAVNDWIVPAEARVRFEANETKDVEFFVIPENRTGEFEPVLTVTRAGTTESFPLQVTVAGGMMGSGIVRFVIIILVIALIVGLLVVLRVAMDRRDEERETKATPVVEEKKVEETFRKKDLDRVEKEKEREIRQLEKQLARAEKRALKEQERHTTLSAKERKKHEKAIAKAEENLKSAVDKARGKTRSETSKEFNDKYHLVPRDEGTSRSHLWILLFVLICLGLMAGGVLNPVVHQALIYVGIVAAALLVLIIFVLLLRAMFSSARRYFFRDVRPGDSLLLNTKWDRGLGECIVAAKDALFKVALMLKKQTSSPAFVTPKGRVYQYVRIDADDAQRSKLKTTYRFKVARSWMHDFNLEVDEVKLAVYKNDKWVKQPTEVVSQDKKYYYFNSTVSGLYSCAIVAKEKKPRPKGNPFWSFLGYVFLVLLIAFVGVALGNIGLGPKTVTTSSPGQIGPFLVEEETTFQVNLSNFFSDPDADQLQFLYDPIENVAISINGDTASIATQRVGKFTTVFYAQDGKGGISSSNDVVIEVIPRMVYTSQEQAARLVRANIQWLAPVLLILVVLCFALRFGPERKAN